MTQITINEVYNSKVSIYAFMDQQIENLVAQKRKSINGNQLQQCAYRSDDGCKCLIGFAIPDDKYKPSMEGVSPRGLLNLYGNELVDDYNVSACEDSDNFDHIMKIHKILGLFQRVHDGCTIIEGDSFEVVIRNRYQVFLYMLTELFDP